MFPRLFCTIILLLSIFAGNSINAQTDIHKYFPQSNQDTLILSPEQIQKKLEVQRQIQEAIREKTRFTPEEIQRVLQSRIQNNKQIPHSGLNKSSDGEILESDEIIISDEEDAESELHAAINPMDSSNIVVSPIRIPRDPSDGLVCPIYYSKDFGKTWKKSLFETKPKDPLVFSSGGGDPMFAFDADGKLYLSWINIFVNPYKIDSTYEEMSWAFSTDGGETWKREANSVIGKMQYRQNPIELYDKQWMMVDQTNSPYRGNLYAGIYHPAGFDGRVGLRRKEANSKEFTQVTVRPVGNDYSLNQFTSVDIDAKGGVHLTFMGDKSANRLHPALYHAISTNGGKTLQKEIKITDIQIPRFSKGQEQVGIIGIPQRIYPSPHFVIDKSTRSRYVGNCYIVWTANGVTKKEANGLDIYLSRSTDNGASWSVPQIVNDDVKGKQSEQFYPSITVNPKGVVCIAWYDRRNDSLNNVNTEYYMAFSYDGGKTFTKNFPITRKPTNFSTVGKMNRGFGIGEYNEILATNSYAIPFWADARNNNGDMNVYAAFVPINSIDTIERISSISGDYELYDAIENDGNTMVKFGFRLAKPSKVKIEIIDMTGKICATVYEGDELEGEHYAAFDTYSLASSMYLYKLTTNYGYAVKSLFVVR